MFALTPQQESLRAAARELAQGEFAPRAAEVDRTEKYPWNNVERLTEAGFMGMTIPTEYGGKGASISTLPWLLKKWPKHAAPADGLLSRRTWAPLARS